MARVTPALDRLPLGFWAALGSGAGAVARLHLGYWVTSWAPVTFPWATLAINVSGSMLLGVLFRALPAPTAPPAARAFLLIGLCGGYTTFSAFDLETWTLLQQGRHAVAMTYAAGSVAACVAGVYCGFILAAARRRRPSHG